MSRATPFVALAVPLLAPLSAVSLVACGSEEEHGAHEFETHEECVEHYEGEGYAADEIEELCADVDDAHEEG